MPAENWPSIALSRPWFYDHVRRLIGQSVHPIAHNIKVLSCDKTGAARMKRHTYRQWAWGDNPKANDVTIGYNNDTEFEKRQLYDGVHILSCVQTGVVVAADVKPQDQGAHTFVHVEFIGGLTS